MMSVKSARQLLMLLVAAAVFAAPAMAQDAATPAKERTELILMRLPLKTSRAYHALRKAAGEATGEILPMTKAEMWSVPKSNVAALRALAKKSGVTIKDVGPGSMNALAPAEKGGPMTGQQSSMMNSAMKDKATMGVSMMALPEPAELEYALTRGMETGDHAAASITLKLSDSVTVTAKRTAIVKDGDSYIWQGSIEDTDEPVTLVVWPMGRMAGTIQHKGRVYKLQNMGGRLHGVIETAPKMLPPEHAPMDGAMREKMNMKDDPLATRGDAGEVMKAMPKPSERIENLRDLPPAGTAPRSTPQIPRQSDIANAALAEPVTITLVVAYTRAAAKQYTDINKDLIALSVADTNLSFFNSGAGNVRIKLVHSYQTKYEEKGSHFDHVFQFTEKGDGIADEIHALRNKYKADIALMIVDDANGCGLAAGVAPEADRAFAVIHHGCAAASYSFAHEIGHLIGARHDRSRDQTDEPVPYAHGFVNGKKWRTMMSYENACDGCPRFPIWSNPDVKVQGEAAGDERANNAKVIRDGAARVAAFR